MNKKAISAIVATVLIILITVAAVAIIWVAIVPMIRGSLQGGTLCLDAVQDFSIDEGGYTCYNVTNKCNASINHCATLSLKVHRGSKKIDLKDIQVLVETEGNTKTYKVSTDSLRNKNSFPKANEDRVYEFDIDGDSAKELINASTFKTPTSVAIVPVLNVKGKEKVCEAAATVTDLQKC